MTSAALSVAQARQPVSIGRVGERRGNRAVECEPFEAVVLIGCRVRRLSRPCPHEPYRQMEVALLQLQVWMLREALDVDGHADRQRRVGDLWQSSTSPGSRQSAATTT